MGKNVAPSSNSNLYTTHIATSVMVVVVKVVIEVDRGVICRICRICRFHRIYRLHLPYLPYLPYLPLVRICVDDCVVIGVAVITEVVVESGVSIVGVGVVNIVGVISVANVINVVVAVEFTKHPSNNVE